MDLDQYNNTEISSSPKTESTNESDPFSLFAEPREVMIKETDSDAGDEPKQDSFFEIVPTDKNEVAEKVFNIFTVLSSEFIGMITGKDSGRYVPKENSKKNIIEALADVLPDTGGNMPPWLILLIVGTATYIPILKVVKTDISEKREQKALKEAQEKKTKIKIIKKPDEN